MTTKKKAAVTAKTKTAKKSVAKTAKLPVVKREEVVKPGTTGKGLAKKLAKANAKKPIVAVIPDNDELEVATADSIFEREWQAQEAAAKKGLTESPDSIIDGALASAPKYTQQGTTFGKGKNKLRAVAGKNLAATEDEEGVITDTLEEEPKKKRSDVALPTFDDSKVQMSNDEMRLEILRLRRLVDCLASKPNLRIFLASNL